MFGLFKGSSQDPSIGFRKELVVRTASPIVILSVKFVNPPCSTLEPACSTLCLFGFP